MSLSCNSGHDVEDVLEHPAAFKFINPTAHSRSSSGHDDEDVLGHLAEPPANPEEVSTKAPQASVGTAPVQQLLLDVPCCDFGRIDWDQEELQTWLLHIRDIRNLTPVSLRQPASLAEGVWLGGLRFADKIAELELYGVRAVVNMLGPWWLREGQNNKKPLYPADWAYLEVQVQDAWGVNIVQDHFLRIYRFMQHCHEENKQIFVHCRMGINRSVTVCVAFLMCLLKWPLPLALHHVVCRRPMSLDNVHFQMELIKLAKVNGLLCRVPEIDELVRQQQQQKMRHSTSDGCESDHSEEELGEFCSLCNAPESYWSREDECQHVVGTLA